MSRLWRAWLLAALSLLAIVVLVGCATSAGEAVDSVGTPEATEGKGTSEGEGVPILSHLGLPIDGQIMPPITGVAAPSVTELNPGIFAVVAGYPATLRFECEDTSKGWYNCFEMELLSVTGPDSPALSDVFKTAPDGGWIWKGCSVIPLPPHDPSDQWFTIETKDSIAAGVYVAKIKVTPYKSSTRAKTLTEIKLVVVQP